jgi:hypothetical protein
MGGGEMNEEQIKHWYAGLAMQAMISDAAKCGVNDDDTVKHAWNYANKMLDRASSEGMVDALRERLVNAERQVADYNERSKNLCAVIKPLKWEGLLAAAMRLAEERDKWREAALKLKNAAVKRESMGPVDSGIYDACNAVKELELSEDRMRNERHT